MEDAMKYLCLIYDDEKQWERMTKEEAGKMFGEYGTFTNDVRASGHYIGGNALQPTATATVRSPRRTVPSRRPRSSSVDIT